MADTIRLTKLELGCLVNAERHGEYFPTTHDSRAACQRLCQLGFLGEHDAAPNRYFITADGERHFMKTLAITAVR